MRFDPSGLKQAFDRMEEGAESHGKTLAEDQSKFFLKHMKKESWKVAPTPSTLNSVAERLKGRLKRKKGVTPMEELQRRMRARGTFARGWAITKTEQAGYRIRIWMVDSSSQSGKVDDEKKVSNKAERITGKSYKSKLDKLADKVTSIF